MTEEWRDVVGYEGVYQVSDLGRVRRVKRGRATRVNRILRPSVHRLGYLRVTFNYTEESKNDTYYVHVLVATAFLGDKPDEQEINHRDGDKTNNQVKNLEYVTHSENLIHAIHVLGVRIARVGSKNNQAKLNEDIVRQIRSRYSSGQYTYQHLADLHGVTKQAIWHIIHRKTWSHI